MRSLFLLLTLILFTNRSEAECKRIISLAPSITETLYQLQLGENVIAVSDYDEYPEDVKSKPRIGGFLNLSLEGLISLKPDIVIGLKEHSEFAIKYKQSGRAILLLDHNTVTGILNSIREISDYCGNAKSGLSLKAELSEVLDAYKARPYSIRPKVLLSVGRSAETPSSRSFFISGKDGFYDELIKYAGGRNVISEKTIFSGSLSAESLIALNPDIIIEILGKDSAKNIDKENIVNSWNDFKNLNAVKNKQIFVIKNDYADIPGPRFIKLLKDFADIIGTYQK